jgi:hypothetical protein
MPFSGSYDQDDVEFLLKPVHMEPTDVTTKEFLIQSGEKHYSEILAPESPPDDLYFRLFEAAFERNYRRMAQDVVTIAGNLAKCHPEGVVLASLARAGTPIGILLRRALLRFGVLAPHVSLSIIRDRGIDTVALDNIRVRWPNLPIRFVDGWTGKGAISRELETSLRAYNAVNRTEIIGNLVVLSDLAGVADIAASGDDYLIPSAILNSVVSGLISRTVLNDEHVGPNDFHACVYYSGMEPADLSKWFVDTVDSAAKCLSPRKTEWKETDRAKKRVASQKMMSHIMEKFDVLDKNRIKPGVGEATRAVLRRVPERILLRDVNDEDVKHLIHLAGIRGAPIEQQRDLPYAAVTIIKKLGSRHAIWKNPNGC